MSIRAFETEDDRRLASAEVVHETGRVLCRFLPNIWLDCNVVVTSARQHARLYDLGCLAVRFVCGGDFHDHSSAHVTSSLTHTHTFFSKSWVCQLPDPTREIQCGMTWKRKFDVRSRSSSSQEYTVASTGVPDYFLGVQRRMTTNPWPEGGEDEHGILEDERCADTELFFIFAHCDYFLCHAFPGHLTEQSKLVPSCPSWKLRAFDQQARLRLLSSTEGTSQSVLHAKGTRDRVWEHSAQRQPAVHRALPAREGDQDQHRRVEDALHQSACDLSFNKRFLELFDRSWTGVR